MTVLGSARLLAAMRYGMPVIDCTGAPVGFIRAVKRADHLAVDATGQRIGQSTDLIALLPQMRAGREPTVASPRVAARLVRLGYVKIDGRSVDRVNRYADAEEIAGVVDDVVQLSVSRDTLPTETH
jgi:hypothetical protein